jgi:hypothetical protein
VTESNPIRIFLRDWSFFFMHLIPSWRRDLRLGYRKEGLVKYTHSPGLPFDPNHKGGLGLPQVYCKRLGGDDVLFSDDVIFSVGKKGLFQLLVYLGSADELETARESVSQIDEISSGAVPRAEVTFLIEDSNTTSNEVSKDASLVYRLATDEEFAQSSLCRGRPEPQYYDHLYLKKALEGNKFVLARPDRFIYAACDNIVDLQKVISHAIEYLHG